jgi:ribosome-associated toxin RatA of RatAB toxin-antitoxin module
MANLRPGGVDMGAVSRSIEIDVSAQQFFDVVVDYARYVEFVGEMRQVQVGRRSGSQVEVTYTIEVAAGPVRKRVSYTLNLVEEAPRKVSWSLVKGEFMKRNDGSWLIEPLGERRICATYTIDVGFGLLVPSGVSDFLTERNLPRMIGEFKARAEKLYPLA